LFGDVLALDNYEGGWATHLTYNLATDLVDGGFALMRRSSLLVLLLILSACGGATPTATPPLNTSIAQTALPVVATQAIIPFDQLKASDPTLIGTTGRPQLVEFFAYWCSVCRSMHPVMEDLKSEYSGVIDFLQLDIDSPATLAARETYRFQGLRPTLVFLDATGNEVARLVGAHPHEIIADLLDSLVAVGG